MSRPESRPGLCPPGTGPARGRAGDPPVATSAALRAAPLTTWPPAITAPGGSVIIARCSVHRAATAYCRPCGADRLPGSRTRLSPSLRLCCSLQPRPGCLHDAMTKWRETRHGNEPILQLMQWTTRKMMLVCCRTAALNSEEVDYELF